MMTIEKLISFYFSCYYKLTHVIVFKINYVLQYGILIELKKNKSKLNTLKIQIDKENQIVNDRNYKAKLKWKQNKMRK